jgi:hypothetical protein
MTKRDGQARAATPPPGLTKSCPVNLPSTIRRYRADVSMVHATLGVRAPANELRAQIVTVAWTIRRKLATQSLTLG